MVTEHRIERHNRFKMKGDIIQAEYIDPNVEEYLGFLIKRHLVYQHSWYVSRPSGPTPRALEQTFTSRPLARKFIEQYCLDQLSRKERLKRELENAGHNTD